MSIAVVLPPLGESVSEGTISQWLVKEGDRVERDQPLVEVTTDKVDVEIPSPCSGIVARIVAAAGEVVPIGAELARIDAKAHASRPGSAPADRPHAAAAIERPGSATIERPGSVTTVRPGSAAADRPRTDAATDRPHTEAPQAAAERAARANSIPRATPLARRVAAALDLDLASASASGPSGRVTKSDVLRDAQRRSSAPQTPQASAADEAGSSEAGSRRAAKAPSYARYDVQDGDRVIPMSPLRRLVAEHMVYSKATSPHVGSVAEIDLGRVVALRERHKRAFGEAHGFSLSFLPFIVHACARALREYPALNASVLDDAIVEKAALHLGIAVETDNGLIVPVVRHADRLSLVGLAAAIEDLANRARTKKLSADELRGGSFTISNPGRHGNLYGFAIINQPQVAIVRMGEIVKRAVVRSADGEDAIVIRPTLHLALSYDHRAVDGVPANGFLHRVRELLERAEFEL